MLKRIPQPMGEPVIPMAIVGAVTLVVGMKMNINPQKFNESIFGKETHESALGEMNAMRMAVGGGLLAISTILLTSLIFIEDETVMATILLSTAIGLTVFLSTVVGAKFRGYTESVPKLPLIVLPILIILCLVGSSDSRMW